MKLKKWLKRDNLIVLVLLGVLLFVISLPTKSDNSVKKEISSIQNTDSAVVETVALGKSKKDYVQELEERLKATLSDMEGVGKVSVMITLKASEELVLEKDESVNRSNTSEEDSEGGKRTVSQLESGESTVYISSGSNSEPYVIKTLLPTVEGVVVVAQGAGTGNVNRNITEIVMALFGVEAHKVQVVKMGSSR